jgi:salicylate hydroxylase
MYNWYGDGIHVIAYPTSKTHTSWAVTQRTTEQNPETWRLYGTAELRGLQSILSKALEGAHDSILELVSSAEQITQYGLYDRPERPPRDWSSERCVLIGDAAHPTSPHLGMTSTMSARPSLTDAMGAGQGANQALEDCYMLSELLSVMDADADEPSPQALAEAFRSFAQQRQPRTTALVRQARAQGEQRVVTGQVDLEQRDENIRRLWSDKTQLRRTFDDLFKEHPY